MDTALVPEALFVDEPDLHENDPSQKDGFAVVYDKECPFEMRLQEHDESPQEVGTLEAIRCRVCVQGDVAAPQAVVRLAAAARARAPRASLRAPLSSRPPPGRTRARRSASS